MLFDEYYDSIPDVDAYLKRIGMDRPVHADLAYLEQLICNHQTHIPFENIDVHVCRKDVSLAIHDLFEKIIINHRGGYCFELNGLFFELLIALGYDATPCLNKVLDVPFNHIISAHRGTVVHYEGKDYYCDIGFGGPVPAGPLLLEPDVRQEIHGDIFRVERRSASHLAMIRTNSHGKDEPIMLINPAPFDQVDFVPYSHYLTCSAETALVPIFKENLMLNIRTADGHASITNSVLKETHNGKITVTDVSSKNALLNALHTLFFLPDSIDSYF